MRKLRTITEIGMLTYWVFAAVVALGWIVVAPELMYAGYESPLMVIWNWSFLPIDVLFALGGLVARYGRLPAARAQQLETVSLTMMFCAGAMALSFWSLQCWFDFVWWGMNGWLIGLALAGLWQQQGTQGQALCR